MLSLISQDLSRFLNLKWATLLSLLRGIRWKFTFMLLVCWLKYLVGTVTEHIAADCVNIVHWGDIMVSDREDQLCDILFVHLIGVTYRSY